MRSKIILKIAAFIIAFGFSTAFASLFITKTHSEWYEFQVNGFQYRNKSADADKISIFISRDKRNGRESDRILNLLNNGIVMPSASLTFTDYVESIERYVDDSSSMETSNLPNDFQTAWREHMNAWRDYSDFLNRVKNSSNRRTWSNEEFEYTEEVYNREISRTWYKVLQIGESYGADVSE